jgi:hypothetical protein
MISVSDFVDVGEERGVVFKRVGINGYIVGIVRSGGLVIDLCSADLLKKCDDQVEAERTSRLSQIKNMEAIINEQLEEYFSTKVRLTH